MSHVAQPTGTFDADGAGRCATCHARLVESIYAGGWMHSNEQPHRYEPYVYGDGQPANERGCVECGRAMDADIHTR